MCMTGNCSGSKKSGKSKTATKGSSTYQQVKSGGNPFGKPAAKITFGGKKK